MSQNSEIQSDVPGTLTIREVSDYVILESPQSGNWPVRSGLGC